MSRLDKITKLYEQCYTARFPYMIEFEINGVCLVLTDDDMFGVLHFFIHRRDKNSHIDKEVFHTIDRLKNELEIILLSINDEAYEYFYNLYTLAKLMIEELEESEKKYN